MDTDNFMFNIRSGQSSPPEKMAPSDSFYGGLNAIKKIIHSRNRSKKRNQFLLSVGIAIVIVTIPYLILKTEPTTHEVLTFDHAPLSKVVAVLEKEFKVSISIPVESKSCPFTGAFYTNSVSSAIQLLAESLAMQSQKTTSNNFQLTGGRCI